MTPASAAGRTPHFAFRLAPAALAALLALGACQRQSAGESDAPVPVLTGTASDAMLPLDTVTSQPPLDPRAARGARGSDPAAEASEAAPDDASAADPAAPAAAAPAEPAE